MGRIVELSKDDGKVMTEHGRLFSLESALEQGYVTVYDIPEHDFIHQKGYATFKFPKPSHISSPIYNVIELLYRYLGRKNIRLENELDWISVFCNRKVQKNAIKNAECCHPYRLLSLRKSVSQPVTFSVK
jgi:hypothetical protein